MIVELEVESTKVGECKKVMDILANSSEERVTLDRDTLLKAFENNLEIHAWALVSEDRSEMLKRLTSDGASGVR